MYRTQNAHSKKKYDWIKCDIEKIMNLIQSHLKTSGENKKIKSN